jgi:hypothetical protein
VSPAIGSSSEKAKESHGSRESPVRSMETPVGTA